MALPEDTEQMVRRFAAEHDDLRDTLALLREVADHLTTTTNRTSAEAMEALRRVHTFLTDQVLPHEHAGKPSSTPRWPDHWVRRPPRP